MVSAMANAYGALSEEERELVFMLAVGKAAYSDDNGNFCKGFAACADDSSGSWWSGWDVDQRDVFFYMKMDPNDENSWSYYCRYSMNAGKDEFDDTIREMLALSSTLQEEEVEITDDSLGDNATFVESEIPDDNDVDTMSFISSSVTVSNFLPVLMLSVIVLIFSSI